MTRATPISKAQLKYFQSLKQQKYRKEYKVYIVEGDKNVKEWIIENAPLKYIVANTSWFQENAKLLEPSNAVLIEAEAYEIQKISMLTTTPEVYAVVPLPEQINEKNPLIENEWVLVLDAIQDPGNFGTIIRIADWFGIQRIVCGEGTVDAFNPKVVQASMGSILRVQIEKESLYSYLSSQNAPIYLSYLSGNNLYELSKDAILPGFIVMGNESNGIQEVLLKLPHTKITIPKKGQAESLNVGIATGIICSHLVH